MVRRAWLLLLGLLLVAVAVGAWSGWRALQVRDDLTTAQAMTTQLQRELTDGQADAALSSLPRLRTTLDRAEGRTSGPGWAVAERFPILGRNLHAVRRTTLAAQVLGDQALPEATAALDLVRRSKPLRNGQVDLAVLAQLSQHLDKASAASTKAKALLAPTDKPLIGLVRDRVAEAQTKVAELDDTLSAAAKALDLAPSMLGRDGARRYFIAVQNNAEARATGGLVGAFAVVKADHGKVTLERTGSDADFQLEGNVRVAADPKAAARWQDEGSTRAWFASNLTPHFPDAAKNMAGLWALQTGQRVDGVMGVDPFVMSDLMAPTGPVTLPDGTSVSSSTIVDFILRDEYVRYPAGPPRKALLSALAGDVFRKVLTAPDSVATLKALAKAGRSGHLLLWSAHPDEQQRLETGLAGGSLPTADTPYLNVLTQDFSGNKLSTYLTRTTKVTRRPDGSLLLTLTLRNSAPLGLPAYVTERNDRPTPPAAYGQSKLGVSVYGALSTAFGATTLDGKPVLMSYDTDHGHPFASVDVELPRNKDVTLTVTLSEPDGVLDLRQQPLVTPDKALIDVPHRVLGS